MKEPPLGYDDESFIPQQHMIALVDEFEERLDAVQKVFNQHFPGEFHVSEDFQGNMWALKHSAEQLGTDHLQFVDDIIHSYESFQKTPNPEKLKDVFNKLRRFRKFLRER